MLEGIETPTFSLIPESSYQSGPEAIRLAETYGVSPFQWQKNVVNAWMGERADGLWSSTVCALCVSRQNGKGEILVIRELYGLFVLDEQILHTAHHGKTADDAFKRLWDVIRNNEELRSQVKRFSEAFSRSFIELKSGARIDFISRTKDSGRGLSIDLLVIDEAQECADIILQALQPTQAAKPNSQLILTGTVPALEANGAVFTKYRTAAIKKTSNRLSWLEWSADPNDDLDSPEVWAKTNPSYGHLITEQTIIDERSGQTDDGFGRERLSIWTPGGSQRVFSEDLWNSQGDPQSKAVESLALAVDVSPDRSRAVVALAGLRPDGHYHIEKYEAKAGTAWVVDYVRNIVEKNDIRAVVVDQMSHAASLLDAFKQAGIKITVTQVRDMAAACGHFYDGIYEGWLFHTGQPEVDFAIGQLRKRPLLGGEAFAWNRRSVNSDITPVVAMTLALFGSMNSKVRRPGGKKKSTHRMITLT